MPSSTSEFPATVTDFRELCRVQGKPIFQLALDVAAFEPVDMRPGHIVGTLTATSRLGAVLVIPITAVLRDSSGQLWHTTDKPLQPGTPVLCQRTV